MSRIGKRPIILNTKTSVEIDNRTVLVKGPKGSLKYNLPNQIKIQKKTNELIVYAENSSKNAKKLHGLSRTMVNNMIIGVSQGFCKILNIHGVGYRAQSDGKQKLILNLGYSHPIHMTAPSGVEVEVKNNTEISIQGISKESVGQFAARVRSKRPPEPYKGKGICYKGEIIRRKVGKAGK